LPVRRLNYLRDIIIGLDLGTTALKIAMFDHEGKLLGVSTKEYSLITSRTSYVEADANVYWNSFKEGLADLKKAVCYEPEEIKALGISAQGETLFFVDENGNPLRNAIVWMDNRAQHEAKMLADKFSNETCYRVTGQVSFEPCWPASKVLWIRNNEPEVFKKTAKVLLIEDYFIFKMTGEYAAEGSLLCSTTYWDIISKKYWKDMLDFIGITEDKLPKIYESGEPVGTLRTEIARELGLSEKTVICTGALDQAAGAIGVGNIYEGIFSENIGAALAICTPVNKPTFDPNRNMPLHYFPIPGMYMMHTFTTGGMTLRWFRDKFCSQEMGLAQLLNDDAYNILSQEAMQVPPGSEGLVMLPHLTGSLAPDVNSKAKGVYFGFTLKHGKAHFVRAIMESIGYILQRNLETLEAMGISVNEIRSLGGGSKSHVWNQIKADITGKKLITMQSKEAACLGAAILAGKATGIYSSIDDAVDMMVKTDKIYSPDPTNRKAYDSGYVAYKKLFANLSQLFDDTFESR
jgi:xylulokinase